MSDLGSFEPFSGVLAGILGSGPGSGLGAISGGLARVWAGSGQGLGRPPKMGPEVPILGPRSGLGGVLRGGLGRVWAGSGQGLGRVWAGSGQGLARVPLEMLFGGGQTPKIWGAARNLGGGKFWSRSFFSSKCDIFELFKMATSRDPKKSTFSSGASRNEGSWQNHVRFFQFHGS